MSNIHVWDTSAILNGELKDYNHINNYIYYEVICELENIKTSAHKDDELKAKARQVVRDIRASACTIYRESDEKSIQRIIKKNHLNDNNDSRILAICKILSISGHDVVLHTSDLCMELLARALHIPVSFSFGGNKEKIWEGYELTNPIGTYKDYENEYLLDEETGDIKRFQNGEYVPLSYQKLNNDYTGKVRPLNFEQKMVFDLLQNPEIKVKLLLGTWGVGKSFLAISHAIDLIKRGKFEKLIFVRNNFEVKNSKELGSLPGSMEDKLLPFMMPIADHVGGEEALRNFVEDGTIEALHLGFARGRDLKHSIILVDEAANLTGEHMRLLLGRVSRDSEIWFCGDIRQTDSKIFDQDNGIRLLIQRLKGNKLFGMVNLKKSERSDVAELASLLE